MFLLSSAFVLFLLLIMAAVMLLPNLLVIWWMRRIRISERIGDEWRLLFLLAPVLVLLVDYKYLFAWNEVLGFIGYILVIIMSFIAIDYCRRGRLELKLLVVLFFLMISFSELALYDYIEKTYFGWQPPR